MRKQAYSILVYNNPGLLSRMAGLFSRRGTILKVLPQYNCRSEIYKDHDRSKWR